MLDSMTGAGWTVGEKRPRPTATVDTEDRELAEARSWQEEAAVGSDLGGCRQCRAQMSAAREAVVCQESSWDQLCRAAQIQRPALSGHYCAEASRGGQLPLPPVLAGLLRFLLYPDQRGKEEGRGEAIRY